VLMSMMLVSFVSHTILELLQEASSLIPFNFSPLGLLLLTFLLDGTSIIEQKSCK
jgi:hypothetical protein